MTEMCKVPLWICPLRQGLDWTCWKGIQVSSWWKEACFGHGCCYAHTGLQLLHPIHSLQQWYFHSGLAGGALSEVSVPLPKQGWWEYRRGSSHSCSWRSLIYYTDSALLLFPNQTPCVITQWILMDSIYLAPNVCVTSWVSVTTVQIYT